VSNPGEDIAIKGALTVCGVLKADIGQGGRDSDSKSSEPYKSAASDALKRAGVHFGIGRYLYKMPMLWAPYDAQKRAFKFKAETQSIMYALSLQVAQSDCGLDAHTVNQYRQALRQLGTSGGQAQAQPQGQGSSRPTQQADTTTRTDQTASEAMKQRVRAVLEGMGQDRKAKADLIKGATGREARIEDLTHQEATAILNASRRRAA
jgi:hypothetical protein